MYVIRIEHTTYALHVNNKTMFMVFKNRNHAHTTESAIREFIGTHQTLPPTYDGKLLPLSNPKDWVHLLYELNTENITEFELQTMCELCNGGYLYVEDMKEPEINGDKLKLSYSGDAYEGYEMTMEETISYLETLI